MREDGYYDDCPELWCDGEYDHFIGYYEPEDELIAGVDYEDE